jgi:hypothetical protein
MPGSSSQDQAPPSREPAVEVGPEHEDENVAAVEAVTLDCADGGEGIAMPGAGEGDMGDEDPEARAFQDCHHEDDPNSRYVDYTCATSWEYFITDVEELLRGWANKAAGAASPRVLAATQGAAKAKCFEEASLDFNDNTYRFVLWRGGPASARMLEDSKLDFDRRLENVQRWFGVSDFLFIWKSKDGESKSSPASMTRSEAGLVLSSLCIALQNCKCGWPAFVPVGSKLYRMPEKDQQVFGGFMDVDDLLGYAVPAAPAAGLVPASTRFETSKALQPPEAYKTLDGFVELFLAKVGASYSAGGGGPLHEADNHGGAAGGAKPLLSVNVEHSWLWESKDYDWAVSPKEWRVAQARERSHHRRGGRDTAIRKLLGVYQGSCEWLEHLWGPQTDPLRSLCLRVHWMNLQEGTFVENLFYSTLQPLQTSPSAWTLAAVFGHEEEGDGGGGSGPSKKAVARLARPASAPLASLLRSLLASYISAQAVPPGTIMTEVVAPDRPRSPVEAEADNEDSSRRQSALMIASILGPGMSALVRELAMQPLPPRKFITDLTSMLFDVTAPETAPPKEETEAAEEGQASEDTEPPSVEGDDLESEPEEEVEEAGSRSLWAWFPRMGSPIGRLVSLLSMVMGSVQSLHAIALLWADVARELRWRWEQSLPIPRLDLIAAADLPGSAALADAQGAMQGPDHRTCLINQKIQLLDLCIREKAAAIAGSSASSDDAGTPPCDSANLSRATSDSDVFFDSCEPGETETEADADGEDESQPEEDEAQERRGVKDGPPGPLTYMLGRSRTALPVVAPVCQEACPLTEDDVLQQRQLLSLVKGSGEPDPGLRALRRQTHVALKLASDMQAFKAANPGCVLADFVRWRSPSHWTPHSGEAEAEGGVQPDEKEEEDEDVKMVWPGEGQVDIQGFPRGLQMDSEDVTQIWRSARPIPASAQKALFNVAQEAEKVCQA